LTVELSYVLFSAHLKWSKVLDPATWRANVKVPDWRYVSLINVRGCSPNPKFATEFYRPPNADGGRLFIAPFKLTDKHEDYTQEIQALKGKRCDYPQIE
jgi:hypothetical protein